MDQRELIGFLGSFLDDSPLNRIEEIGINRIFDEPLVGIADAKDSLFIKLKEPEVIGPNHLLPLEWLSEAESVISYFLPFSKPMRKANYSPGLPATEWVYGRIEGEICNEGLRKHLVSEFLCQGYSALAPALDSRLAQVKKRSNWSERHVAFIAGLGTFGLSKLLISAKGCAGRYGSIIVSQKLQPTPRSYQDVYEYCTKCWQCIERCPSGAIKKEGKDITICSKYGDTVIKPRFAPRYGCGKCQTTVPCEAGIP